MILANDCIIIEVHVVLKWNTEDSIVLIAKIAHLAKFRGPEV
jgi:hypothetical protein